MGRQSRLNCSPSTGERVVIAIVGAGIAGLSLAAGLQHAGVEVLVLEERESLSGGAGITLWPNALSALDDLGVGDAVRAAGKQVGTGAVRTPQGRTIRAFDDTELVAALGEPLIAIHRQRLIELLAARLRPGTIRWGHQVRGVRPSTRRGAERVEIELADGSELGSSALVGADGVRSAVARTLNPGLAMTYSGFSAWRGIATVGLDGGGQVWGEGAEFGWVPLGPRQTYWFAARRSLEGEDLSPQEELARLDAAFGHWHGPAAELIAQTAPADLARHDLHDRAIAKRWSLGPIALIGDAAHPMRPNLGQGGCQGIEDAAVLCRLLSERGDSAGACAEYTRLRRRRARRVARQSWLMGTMIGVRPTRAGDAIFRLSSWLPQRALLAPIASVASARAYREASV